MVGSEKLCLLLALLLNNSQTVLPTGIPGGGLYDRQVPPTNQLDNLLSSSGERSAVDCTVSGSSGHDLGAQHSGSELDCEFSGMLTASNPPGSKKRGRSDLLPADCCATSDILGSAPNQRRRLGKEPLGGDSIPSQPLELQLFPNVQPEWLQRLHSMPLTDNPHSALQDSMMSSGGNRLLGSLIVLGKPLSVLMDPRNNMFLMANAGEHFAALAHLANLLAGMIKTDLKNIPPENQETFIQVMTCFSYSILSKGVTSAQWEGIELVLTGFLSKFDILKEDRNYRMEDRTDFFNGLIWISEVLYEAVHPGFFNRLTRDTTTTSLSVARGVTGRTPGVKVEKGCTTMIKFLALHQYLPGGKKFRRKDKVVKWLQEAWTKDCSHGYFEKTPGGVAVVVQRDLRTWELAGLSYETLATQFPSPLRIQHKRFRSWYFVKFLKILMNERDMAPRNQEPSKDEIIIFKNYFDPERVDFNTFREHLPRTQDGQTLHEYSLNPKLDEKLLQTYFNLDLKKLNSYHEVDSNQHLFWSFIIRYFYEIPEGVGTEYPFEVRSKKDWERIKKQCRELHRKKNSSASMRSDAPE